MGEGTLTLAERGAAGASHTVTLPQTSLARLALGACDPADELARLERPPDEALMSVLQALFPTRHQHMYLPDRY